MITNVVDHGGLLRRTMESPRSLITHSKRPPQSGCLAISVNVPSVAVIKGSSDR
jgi:hypothetical protein